MKKNNNHKKLDMLHGPIWNKLPLFALPVAATAVLEQLFNASDLLIVGNFSGDGKTVAVAAVGANSSIISLIVNLFVGISLGVNVVIANAIGRNDKSSVTKSVHTSVIVSLLAGVFVMILGEIIADSLMSSVMVPEDVFHDALLYLRIYLIGMPVILLYNFEAAIFRSIGDTKTPLVILALSGILNVLLNLFFVAVLGMSVNGVAIATVVSNVFSAALLFYILVNTNELIHVDIRQLWIDGKVLRQIMKIGFPAGIQGAVFALSNIVIQSAINSLGLIVMAASAAAYSIEIFAYIILNSFSLACTTFVGQNYGAGQLLRCRKILILCIAEDAIATVFSILLILFTGKELLSFFNDDPHVISTGYTRLVMVFSTYIFSMFYENMSGYMRGFGISLIPALVTTLGICGVRILWIEEFFPFHRSFSCILTAYPASLSVTAVMIFIVLVIFHPSKRNVSNNGEIEL